MVLERVTNDLVEEERWLRYDNRYPSRDDSAESGFWTVRWLFFCGKVLVDLEFLVLVLNQIKDI